MAGDIFKRIIIAFGITFAISMICILIYYRSLEGNEAKQIGFMVVCMIFLLNILNFLAALPAFLNLNVKVREFYPVSFLAFCGLPLLILMIMSILCLNSSDSNRNPAEFLIVDLPSVLFCIIMLIQFLLFRKKWDQSDN